MQAFYSIRSERQLVERIDHDLLFRWFVGLGIEDAVWDATTFTKNRDRLLEGEVARRRTVARQGQKAAVERVLFDYAILGTEALRARPGFQQRAVRASRPARGATASATSTRASGHAERLAALALIEPHAERRQPITLGADKGYDASDFVMELRDKAVTPHVAQDRSAIVFHGPCPDGEPQRSDCRRGDQSGHRSAIDGRTTCHPGRENSAKPLPNRHLEIAEMLDKFSLAKPTIKGEPPMWKAPASVLCGCLAALPLIGCAGNVGTSAQATAVTPAALAEPEPNYAPARRVYAVGPAAPAAVLVLWTGDDTLARDPALWTAQGFDVVMPLPADIYRLVADQQAAVAQLVAAAHALADAPIWIVGPGPVIDATLAAPQLRRGVSGVVMTSVASDSGSCSESFSYSDPGTGAPPKVEVRRSGDCGTGTPAIGGRQPSVLPAPPRPNQPRLIEASAVGKNLQPAAKVRHLAELIKATPPG